MADPFTPSTVSAGFGAETTINSNFNAVDTAFQTCLNKDDATDNAMDVDLDMNGNDILNVSSLSVKLTSYTIAQLGSTHLATANARELVWCSDETGGATPVFSDGTNWRRVHDYAVAS